MYKKKKKNEYESLRECISRFLRSLSLHAVCTLSHLAASMLPPEDINFLRLMAYIAIRPYGVEANERTRWRVEVRRLIYDP